MWQDDKRWSDRFLPEIKQILGLYLIDEPPIEEDMQRNADLTVLRLNAVRVACRIRKYEYFLSYDDEITIREGRPSGMRTELSKIVQGWSDYMFYGFADKFEKHLHAWRLIDLGQFRLWFNRSLAKRDRNIYPGTCHHNRDGSSSFRAFNVNELDNDCIVAQYMPPAS